MLSKENQNVPLKNVSWFLLLVRYGRWMLLLGSLFLMGGCGKSLAPGAPIIRDFTFLSQEPSNPQIFYFKIDWQDAESDLATKPASSSENGNGELKWIIEVPNKSNITLSNVIKFEAISTDGKTSPAAGVFPKIQLTLAPGSKGEKYPDQIKITVYLVDSKGNESNRPWVTLTPKAN